MSYFKDKTKSKKNAGAKKGIENNRAKGAFYIKSEDGKYVKKWEYSLDNEVSPVSALVADNGKYIVTFDNWHSVGYGDNVVVIYRSDGTLVKKFALDDVTPKNNVRFSISVSSIWWGGEHYLNKDGDVLILKIVSNGESPWVDKAQYVNVRINLASGQILDSK